MKNWVKNRMKNWVKNLAATNKKSVIPAVLIIVFLIAATRGHTENAWMHAPDLTLPILFIAGVYLRRLWIFLLIVAAAVAVDNYAIVHQGVGAHCITPAYAFLPVSFWLLFAFGKIFHTLALASFGQFFRLGWVMILAVFGQWLIATASYYAFTQMAWSDFGAYASKWAAAEILPTVLIIFAAVLFATLCATHFSRRSAH